MSEPTLFAVDDHPVRLKLACNVLESEGHTVLLAQDAAQAQELLAPTLPDLSPMDLGGRS